MTNRNTQEKGQVKADDSVAFVFLAVGFALYITYNVLCYLSSAYRFAGAGNEAALQQEMVLRFFSLLFFAAVLFLNMNNRIAVFTTRARNAKGPYAVLLVILLAFAGASATSDVPWACRMAAWAMQGVCSGVLFLFFGMAWSLYLGKSSWRKNDALSLGCVVSAIAFASVMFAPDVFLTVCVTIFGIASVVLCFMLFFRMEPREEGLSEQAENESQAKQSLPGRLAVHLIVIGVFVGFISGFATRYNASSTMLYIIAGASVLAVIVNVAYTVKAKRILDFVLAERMYFALLAAGSALLFLPSAGLASAAIFFICVFGNAVFFFSQWGLLVDWSRKYQLPPVTHYAWGSVTWLGGFAIGWGVQTVSGYFQRPDPDGAMIAVYFILVAFLVFAASFSPFGSESTIGNAGKAEAEVHEGEGFWSSSVREIAEEYGLSSRESEIFTYLAKGRNAGFIREELILSEHTVKTHIYHIYKKLGVKSQQNLINMVENHVEDKKNEMRSKTLS